jgi:hypothetical protein
LGHVWSEHYEVLTKRLLAATDAEATEWGHCPKCRTKVSIVDPDVRTHTDAIAKPHELAGLRPKPDASTAATAPTVIRRIVLPGGREIEGGQAGSAPSVQDD